jgi:hypothetical protein
MRASTIFSACSRVKVGAAGRDMFVRKKDGTEDANGGLKNEGTVV